MNPIWPGERTYYTTTTQRLEYPNHGPQPLDPPFYYYEQDPLIVNNQCFTNLYTGNRPSVRLEPFNPVAYTSTRMKEPYSQFRDRIGGVDPASQKSHFNKGSTNDDVVADIVRNQANRTEYMQKYCHPNQKLMSLTVMRRAIFTGKEKLKLPRCDWLDLNYSAAMRSYRDPADIEKIIRLEKVKNCKPTGYEEWPIMGSAIRKRLYPLITTDMAVFGGN